MKRLLRIARRVLIIFIAVLLIIGGGGYLWLRGALPQISGSVRVQGINAPIEIIRDAAAVPHIRAKGEADAHFGMGYAHAQDRLWQMEFQRRIGHGRLSEVLGDASLEIDRFIRVLGPARAAQRAWERLTPATRSSIEAYVAGINAFISTHHGHELPVEFTLLGFAPEPWQPIDVLVWSKMMAWDLGGNWGDELLRTKLVALLGPTKADQLMPTYTPDGPVIVSQGDALPVGTTVTAPIVYSTMPINNSKPSFVYDHLLAIDRGIQASLRLGGKAIGSNNWVIGGSRTTTGKPLLANDPHLGTQIPSNWYLAHVTDGTIDTIGASLPGLPGIIIGHNRHIAWGVTNTAPDVQDLFVEHVNDRDEVEYKGVWEPMQILPELIKVKDQPDVTVQVRITRHGPLISDVLEGADQRLAFRWTGLDDEDRTVEAFLKINRATNWKDFTDALSIYHSPMQNFVYADVEGNIGYYAPGALPVRGKGDGRSPVPGWTGEYDWQGYVPFQDLPRMYNPRQSFIVTANNKVAPNTYPYLIGSSFSAPYRAQRIIQMIESKAKLSPDDIAAMQADVLSVHALELLPSLLQATPPDEQSRAAIEFLRGWDGTMRGDSPQAALYQAWYRHIPARIFADELKEVWQDYAGLDDFIGMVLPGLLKQNDAAWCDDVGTPQTEQCGTVLGNALANGIAEMTQLQGTEIVSEWRWDRVHQAVFPHNPFDNVDLLRSIFSRSVPASGDSFTVNVGPPNQDDGYNQYYAASYRQIVDLSNWDNSRYIHTVGQSGYVLSSEYSDLLDRWRRVEYLPMRYEQQHIVPESHGTLILEPENTR